MPSDRPNKPHGTFTPASTISRVLTSAGFVTSAIRKGEALSGHRCSWDRVNHRVLVGYRCGDDTPDSSMHAEHTEALSLYEQVLTAKGYRVERDERFLYVYIDKEK